MQRHRKPGGTPDYGRGKKKVRAAAALEYGAKKFRQSRHDQKAERIALPQFAKTGRGEKLLKEGGRGRLVMGINGDAECKETSTKSSTREARGKEKEERYTQKEATYPGITGTKIILVKAGKRPESAELK